MQTHLDLYDFRRRVFDMHAQRAQDLASGAHEQEVARAFRRRRDDLFAHHPQSALDAEARRSFSGLSYYEYDPSFRVAAEVDADVEPSHVTIDTGHDIMPFTTAAILRFTIDNRAQQLTVYWLEVYGGGLFLPFRDLTCGNESYGGGRYLFDTIKGSDFQYVSNAHDRIVLDFNYAYNPSCAYSHNWACPLAPRENWLDVGILAGEKVLI